MITKELQGDILTRKQAAAYLSICTTSLDRASLPSVRIGRRRLFRKAALDLWLEKNEQGGKKKCR